MCQHQVRALPQVSKLVKEKNVCASEIMADLNRQVRKWGLDVRWEQTILICLFK